MELIVKRWPSSSSGCNCCTALLNKTPQPHVNSSSLRLRSLITFTHRIGELCLHLAYRCHVLTATHQAASETPAGLYRTILINTSLRCDHQNPQMCSLVVTSCQLLKRAMGTFGSQAQAPGTVFLHLSGSQMSSLLTIKKQLQMY